MFKPWVVAAASVLIALIELSDLYSGLFLPPATLAWAALMLTAMLARIADEHPEATHATL